MRHTGSLLQQLTSIPLITAHVSSIDRMPYFLKILWPLATGETADLTVVHIGCLRCDARGGTCCGVRRRVQRSPRSEQTFRPTRMQPDPRDVVFEKRNTRFSSLSLSTEH